MFFCSVIIYDSSQINEFVTKQLQSAISFLVIYMKASEEEWVNYKGEGRTIGYYSIVSMVFEVNSFFLGGLHMYMSACKAE